VYIVARNSYYPSYSALRRTQSGIHSDSPPPQSQPPCARIIPRVRFSTEHASSSDGQYGKWLELWTVRLLQSISYLFAVALLSLVSVTSLLASCPERLTLESTEEVRPPVAMACALSGVVSWALVSVDVSSALLGIYLVNSLVWSHSNYFYSGDRNESDMALQVTTSKTFGLDGFVPAARLSRKKKRVSTV